jgi:hypothetical protein
VIQVLGDLVVLFLPVLPLNMLHLVLEPQFQLFQPDFFQLLVISSGDSGPRRPGGVVLAGTAAQYAPFGP